MPEMTRNERIVLCGYLSGRSLKWISFASGLLPSSVSRIANGLRAKGYIFPGIKCGPRATNPAIKPDKSDFVGFCRPTLGNLEPDAVAQSLSRKR